MPAKKYTFLLALSAIALSSCDSDTTAEQPSAEPETFGVSLVRINLQKKGSRDRLVMDALPIEGATVTRE